MSQYWLIGIQYSHKFKMGSIKLLPVFPNRLIFALLKALSENESKTLALSLKLTFVKIKTGIADTKRNLLILL